MLTSGMPKKVMWKAQQLGVHNDCLISESMCATCEVHVMMAFEYFYGHAENSAELISAIIEDFRNDSLEELDG